MLYPRSQNHFTSHVQHLLLLSQRMPPATLASLCTYQIEVTLLTALILEWGRIWMNGAHLPIPHNFGAASVRIHRILLFIHDRSVFPPCLTQLFTITSVLEKLKEDLARACTRSGFVGPRALFSRSFSSARAFGRLFQGCKYGFLRIDRAEAPRVLTCPYVMSACGVPPPGVTHPFSLSGCFCAQCY